MVRKPNLYLSLLSLVLVAVIVLTGFVVAALLQTYMPDFAHQSVESVQYSADRTYLVTQVIDGDTIQIEGGQKVRYIGIDTPETVDPRRPDGCFGKEATEQNTELVAGKQVQLVKDVSETDKYGRLLRYVYVDGIFVNEALVSQGYAKVSTYPPDVKFSDLLLKAEKQAKLENKGLWSDFCTKPQK